MADTVSDFLLERLCEWGVNTVYGYPGDGINGIVAAFGRSEKPKFVQARHEEMAAFMATGHAKFSGQVGVCLATSGPGAIHLLNGLYDAKLDHQPVVAIVGQQSRTALGGNYQQEVDLQSLFKDVAHEYVHTVMVPEQLPAVIDRAIRIAITERTVTCLIIPADVQEMKAEKKPAHEFKITPGSVGMSESRVIPSQRSVEAASKILNEGKKVAMLIGQGARGAEEEILEIRRRLGAGIAKALLGKDVLADNLPFVTGSIGLLGTRASYEMMMGCDTLLMIGSSFPYSQFLPPFDKARGVQIDIDGKMIGIRYPMEANLIGDAKSTLRELIPLIQNKEDRSWEEEIGKEIADWWKVVEARAMQDAEPVNPQRIFWELSQFLPDNCIITGDSGSSTNWLARDVLIRSGMRVSLAGTLATMGSAMPYAIGAKFSHPDRPVVALVGDGAMQMNGMNELLTIKKYWQEWENPQLVILVLHNNDLNQVTWEQRAMTGEPKVMETQVLPDFNYAAYAELVGFKGIRVERPEDVAPAWEEAFRSEAPVLIDALADPNVPPLPPHVTWDQAKSLMKAIMKGDPDSGDIIRNAFRGKLEEFK